MSTPKEPGPASIEVRCPDCGVKFEVPEKQAERENKARCPKGHDVPLAKMI